MSDDKKIIFSMNKVGKQTPEGKQIIKNIHLSFFYGAKIGILGLNGAGKSTILDALSFALFGKAHRNVSKKAADDTT